MALRSVSGGRGLVRNDRFWRYVIYGWPPTNLFIISFHLLTKSLILFFFSELDQAYPPCILNGNAVSKTFQILYRSEELLLDDVVLFRTHVLVESHKVRRMRMLKYSKQIYLAWPGSNSFKVAVFNKYIKICTGTSIVPGTWPWLGDHFYEIRPSHLIAALYITDRVFRIERLLRYSSYYQWAKK